MAELVAVFREVRRVLRGDGVLFVNQGDSYAGSGKARSGGGNGPSSAKQVTNAGAYFETDHPINYPGIKPKDLIGIPWMVAFALRADGWYLRSDIIWHKPNPMPESVKGSHWERHRVTVEEYENLSGVPYTAKRHNQSWPGNMPGMSADEISRGEAALSAKRKRQTNGTSERRATGCEDEEESVCSINTRDSESEEISSNAQGEGESDEAGGELSNPEGKRGRSPKRAGLDRDHNPSQEPVLLLSKESIQPDDGSRNPIESRRQELPGEHRSGVQKLQLQETKQDRSSLLMDCPGCPICEPCGGYVLHLSAGRPTKAHEYLFLLSKSAKYWYDSDAIAEPLAEVSIGRYQHAVDSNEQFDPSRHKHTNGVQSPMELLTRAAAGVLERGVRNKRTVWTVPTGSFNGAHFACFPPDLIKPCILAGCPVGGTVLDCFGGSGTSGMVARELGRNAILIELNPAYIPLIEARINVTPGLPL